MNVLHLTLSFLPGGRRRAIVALADQLRKENVRCDLGCLDELGCNPAEINGSFGSFDVFGRRSAFDWHGTRGLARYCRSRQIDVIHAHDAASQFRAALVRLWKPRHKLLMTFHRSLNFESATARDRVRNAFANSMTGAVVIGSNERRVHFLSENYIRPEKVVRIPFGIDTNWFRPDPAAGAAIRSELGIDRDTFVVGAVGHFGPEKGIDLVVRGFQRLSAMSLPRPTALVVVGSGTEVQQRSLRELVAATPTARIHLAGFQSDVHRWFSAFDLFVHAPRLEAFGLVLLEAMASRLAVVATRVGGITDIVREGSTGILVPPNAPEELANAMQRLVCDRPLCDFMAENARNRVMTEYGADRYAQRYLGVYHALLQNRRPVGVDGENGNSQDDPGITDSTASLSDPSRRTA